MDKKVWSLVILKLKNLNFINTKPLFQLRHVDITKIVLSNKVPFGIKGFKYFIGNKDDKKVRPLCIMVVMYIDIFVLSFLNLES